MAYYEGWANKKGAVSMRQVVKQTMLRLTELDTMHPEDCLVEQDKVLQGFYLEAYPTQIGQNQ